MVPELEEQLAKLEEDLKLALVETDPADRKDVIVEIRQGVGGDEAALWAADIFRMLTRYAERLGYKVEQLEVSGNESGGFKEVVFAVKGDGAYSVFKWEAGTHRVQRVPRPSRRGGSTPRPRRSRSCPRPKRSRSRSTRTTSRSTSTARPGPAARA